MKIERVDLIHVKIPLVHHFETSYGRRFHVDKVIMKVHTADLTAFSELVADLDLGYAYETIDTSRTVLANHILPRILGQEIDGPEGYWAKVGSLTGHPMAKAGLDNAVWILKGLEEGKSLARLTGGTMDKIVSGGVSVGIQDSVEDFMAIVEERIGRGAHRIKLKIKPGWDVGPLEAFRNKWPDMDLSVDANNCYDYYEHHDFLTGIDKYGLIMFEQPMSSADLFYHSKLQAEIETPICLDESIHSPFNAKTAVEMKAGKIINIKQARCGGLTPARQVHDIAQAAGITCWCGGMIETGIGMTVNTAVSSWPDMVYPNAVYSNANFLVEDIIDPITAVDGQGMVAVPTAPGLGVEVDLKALDKYTVWTEVFRA